MTYLIIGAAILALLVGAALAINAIIIAGGIVEDAIKKASEK